MIDTRLLEELKETPLAILTIKDKETLDYLNNLIPYSTGFEIECDASEDYNVDNFKNIPDIMEVASNYGGSGEQRYRIPNGIKGMICLYNICYQLKINSLLNPLSGIHYHIDCTDCFKPIRGLLYDNEKWILEELDTWNFGGTQHRGIQHGSWVRANSLETLEFRVGNMTFDYKIILSRIISANSIVRKLKDKLQVAKKPEFEKPDAIKLIAYYKYILTIDVKRHSRILALNKRLEELTAKQIKEKPNIVEEVKSMYRDRVHFINQNK